MRIAIVACDIFRNEIESLTADDPDFVHREYLEFALHEFPQDMRARIIDTVNALKGHVDAVLLGYATCSSLDGIEDALDVPTVRFPGCDCIDVLLGPEEYCSEKKRCIGTWFSSPGWAIEGKAGLIKEFHLDSVPDIDPDVFLEMMFESYERSLFIDTGVGDPEEYYRLTKEFADSLGLRTDRRTCTLERIQKCIDDVKELASRVVRQRESAELEIQEP